LHTITAENAAGIIDVIHAGVAFARRNAIRVCIFRRFNVNAIRRARRRAKKTADALLQTVFVAVQYVDAAISWLEMHRFVLIVLRHSLSEYVPECDAEALH